MLVYKILLFLPETRFESKVINDLRIMIDDLDAQCFWYTERMAGRYIPYEWPSDNASVDGDLGHPDFNYSRHGIDNSRASASYRNDPTVAMLRMLSEVWLSMPIALFGIVGNLISLVVLCYHRRLKKLQTIVVQLQALAVVDTLILVTILLLRFFSISCSVYCN